MELQIINNKVVPHTVNIVNIQKLLQMSHNTIYQNSSFCNIRISKIS